MCRWPVRTNDNDRFVPIEQPKNRRRHAPQDPPRKAAMQKLPVVPRQHIQGKVCSGPGRLRLRQVQKPGHRTVPRHAAAGPGRLAVGGLSVP